MSDIFVGLILLFFNFNLNLGASSIGLLPSFVGAYMIWTGTRELAAESETMRELDTVLKVAIGVHAVIWVCNFFGMTRGKELELKAVDVVLQLLNLFILHQLTGGMEDLEKLRGVDMRVEMLKRWWMGLFVFSMLNVLWFLGLRSVLCTIGWFVALLGYLVCFSDGKKAYIMSTECPGGIVQEEEEHHDP